MLDAPLSGSNPLNEDPPETTEEFVTNFNESAIGYLDEIESYELILNEVEETNSIGEEFINLVMWLVILSWQRGMKYILYLKCWGSHYCT